MITVSKMEVDLPEYGKASLSTITYSIHTRIYLRFLRSLMASINTIDGTDIYMVIFKDIFIPKADGDVRDIIIELTIYDTNKKVYLTGKEVYKLISQNINKL